MFLMFIKKVEMHLGSVMMALHYRDLKEANRHIGRLYEELSLFSWDSYKNEIEGNSAYINRLIKAIQQYTFLRNYFLVHEIYLLIEQSNRNLNINNLDFAEALLEAALDRLTYAHLIYLEALRQGVGQAEPYFGYPHALQNLDNQMRKLQEKCNGDRIVQRVISNKVNFGANQVVMGLDRSQADNNPNASALGRFGKFSRVIERPKQEEKRFSEFASLFFTP